MQRRSLTRGLGFLLCLSAAAVAMGCGDDEGDAASAGGLKDRLVPPKQVELEVEQEFEWDNATDFVVQGPYRSQATAPSGFIEEIEDAGFEAAAGETLKDENGEVFAFVGAASFASEDGALEALDAIHSEDLKQPCVAACVVTPEDYTVEGIPDSLAVHHVPNEGPVPPGLFKVEAYHVEFTIGSDLYLFQVSGPPGLSKAEFDRDARAVYGYVTAQD